MEKVVPDVGGSKKKMRNKKKRKKKSKRTKIPVVVQGTPLLSSARDVADTLDYSIVYSKSVTGAMEVMTKDIKPRGETQISFDVLLILHGYGPEHGGVFCDLGGSSYVFTNTSPYSLTVRIQRPMGFVDDCTSLAMWEALGTSLVYVLKPGGVLRVGSSNGRTSHMVPRELSDHGRRCVHLLSFSIFREVLAASGLPLSDTQIAKDMGLTVEFVSRYRGVNGDVGKMPAYVVKGYQGSDRLDHVVTGPMVATRVSDLSIPAGPCTHAQFGPSALDPNALQLKFYAGSSTDAPDLDKTSMFSLSTGIVTYSSFHKGERLRTLSRVIKWEVVGSQGEWMVGSVRYDNGGWVYYRDLRLSSEAKTTSFANDIFLASSDVLQPLVDLSTTTSFARAANSKRFRAVSVPRSSARRNYSEVDAGIWTTLINGIVIIYNVSKLAVEILGVVGALATPGGEDGVLCEGV